MTSACFFAETEPWMAAASVTEYGDPDTEAELLRLLSPLTHLDAVRTPMLLIHGDRDTNVPTAESVRAHDALRAGGVPTELLLLPGEGHTIVGVGRPPSWRWPSSAWFRRWLGSTDEGVPMTDSDGCEGDLVRSGFRFRPAARLRRRSAGRGDRPDRRGSGTPTPPCCRN